MLQSRSQRWAVMSTGLGLLSCVEARQIPEAAETEALLAAYAEPTGVLSAEEIQNTLEEFEGGEPVVRTFDDQAYAAPVVEATSALTGGSGDVDLGRIKFAGEAALHLEKECEPSSSGTGVFRSHVTFSLSGLHPVIWGELDECTRQTSRGPLRFTGDFVISLDRVDGFEVDPDYWTAQFTGSIEDVSRAGSVLLEDGTFDAQRRGRQLSARIVAGDGGWAFLSYDEAEPTALQLIDREAIYTCDILQQSCSFEEKP